MVILPTGRSAPSLRNRGPSQVVADLGGFQKRLGRVAWTACEEESCQLKE